MPPSQITQSIYQEPPSPQLSAKDMADATDSHARALIRQSQAVSYGQLQVGCDGKTHFRLLNGKTCCPSCPPVGTGPIVAGNATLGNGTLVPLSNVSPPVFQGTGGQTSVSFAASFPGAPADTSGSVRDRVRFFDSKGNWWGAYGAYLGAYPGGVSGLFPFSGYWYEGEEGGGPQHMYGPGVVTDLVIGLVQAVPSGNSGEPYAGGPTGHNVAIRGNCSVATGGGYWKNDDVVFGFERRAGVNLSSLGLGQGVIRHPSTLELIDQDPNPPVLAFGTPRNKTHVSATADGSFWAMRAGDTSRRLRRHIWNGAHVAYVETVIFPSGGGSVAWDTNTIVNGYLLP